MSGGMLIEIMSPDNGRYSRLLLISITFFKSRHSRLRSENITFSKIFHDGKPFLLQQEKICQKIKDDVLSIQKAGKYLNPILMANTIMADVLARLYLIQ